MSDDDPDEDDMRGMVDTETGMKNILQVLQEKPRNYLCFGVWWWPVKALLKQRYTTDDLYYLGNYVCPDGSERIPAHLSERQIRFLALQEYVLNDRHGMTSREVFDYEGEPYVIHDDDAAGL